MHYIFLTNSLGDKQKLRYLENAVFKLKQRLKVSAQVLYTVYPGHGAVLAEKYAKKYKEKVLIVACGGDGTIHEVANQLIHTSTPMLVMPMGTGNDFARSILSPEHYQQPFKMLEEIEKISVVPIDMIKIESYDQKNQKLESWSRYSINITSFGLDTMVQSMAKQIVSSTKHRPFIRKNAYTAAVIGCLIKGWDFKMGYKIKLATGEVVENSLQYVLAGICNGQYYGNGFRPAPQAKLDDGKLNFCVVEDLSLLKVLPLISRYKKGTHIGHPKIKTYEVVEGSIFSVKPDLGLQGNYDGEDFWGHRVDFSIVPKSLNLAVISNISHN